MLQTGDGGQSIYLAYNSKYVNCITGNVIKIVTGGGGGVLRFAVIRGRADF